MKLRIGRTLPPAAAPIPLKDIVLSLPSCFSDSTGDFCFEDEIKQEFEQRYCILVSSGKAALVLILKALQKLYPERDEVLISAFTCYSVPAAIKRAGLKIKLCDTGAASLDLDQKQLRKIIEADNTENKILCVLVTHLFGCPADFAGIKEIVGDKIPIVEDAAQALGEEIENKKMGTLADVGFFSLGRGKALSTMEGGVIVTNRNDLGNILTDLLKKIEISSVFDKLKLAVKTILTTVLQHPVLFCLPKALPFLRLGETIYEEEFPIGQMSSFQKKLGIHWYDRLKGHRKVRLKNIAYWEKKILKAIALICKRRESISLIRLPVLMQSTKDRDTICMESEYVGCGLMPTYPTPVNEIPQISREFVGQQFPNAKKLAQCLLTIPVHDYVKEEDRMQIMKLINSCRLYSVHKTTDY